MKSVKEIGPADVWDVLDVRDVVDVWHFEKVEIKTIDINKRWIRSIFNCEKNEEKFLSKENSRWRFVRRRNKTETWIYFWPLL